MPRLSCLPPGVRQDAGRRLRPERFHPRRWSRGVARRGDAARRKAFRRGPHGQRRRRTHVPVQVRGILLCTRDEHMPQDCGRRAGRWSGVWKAGFAMGFVCINGQCCCGGKLSRPQLSRMFRVSRFECLAHVRCVRRTFLKTATLSSPPFHPPLGYQGLPQGLHQEHPPALRRHSTPTLRVGPRCQHRSRKGHARTSPASPRSRWCVRACLQKSGSQKNGSNTVYGNGLVTASVHPSLPVVGTGRFHFPSQKKTATTRCCVTSNVYDF